MSNKSSKDVLGTRVKEDEGMMRHDKDDAKPSCRVTVRLPREVYEGLADVAKNERISLSQCIRDYLIRQMGQDIALPAFRRACLHMAAEILYYNRVKARADDPEMVSVAKMRADEFVKKFWEGN